MIGSDQIKMDTSKVLVVDDVVANLPVLRSVLEPRGNRILLVSFFVVAESGGA